MNIDELANEIRSVSNEKTVLKIIDSLLQWKQNDDTVEDLYYVVERNFGYSWIEKDEDHNSIYNLWSTFKDEAISGIQGMTMNERLYMFCLFDEFDKCKNKQEKLRIYTKLMGSY